MPPDTVAATGTPRGVVSQARSRLREYARLMRMDRPIGTFLLLWPALWALWIAGAGRPDPFVVVVFIAGVFLMRSAGCVINDFADRRLDPHVARTRGRPLAAGTVRPWEALTLFCLLGLAALGLVLLLNRLTLYLAVPGAVLAAIYPFVKRVTYLPQVALGVAFGWAIPMAFAALTNSLPVECWLLFIANILWATAYDTVYAMVDRADDLKIGVKSTAILFGESDRVMIAVIQALFLGALGLTGLRAGLGWPYYTGLLAAALLLAWEHRLMLRRGREACFRAFLHNNWVGLAVFCGIAANYLFGP